MSITWHKALEPDELGEGRVKTVTCGRRTLCMTHHEGSYGALDNKCPHQGGPLGEGSIENGLLRCPWHGWDYHPIDGKAPGYDDGVQTHPVEMRDDGVYVGIEEVAPHQRTVTDVMAETMVDWGISTMFGMVGHSNLGLADALRRQEAAGRLRYYTIEVPVWGEIGATTALLTERLADGAAAVDARDEIAERWSLWRIEKQHRAGDDRGRGLNSASIFAALTEAVPDDAIIAVDVGNNTYSFGRYFECRRQAVLMSGYLGSIGFSFPAAMGAWVATQEDDARFRGRKVVSVSGDGGFGQYMGEITTAVKYGMNITHVLLNNCELGKISKEQRAGDWAVWQTSLHNPDFAAYAHLCGAHGIRVTQSGEIAGALAEALAQDGPSLVELVTDADLV